MRRVIDEKPGRMMVGEIAPRSLSQVLSYYGSGSDELNLVFNFFFLVRRFRAADFRDIITRTLDALPDGAWPAWVLSNHDVVRAVTRYHLSPQMATAMMGLLLTIRGTPFLYNGEELGLANTPLPRHLLRDPVGKRYWPLPVGRDGERTPMPWDESPHAGFTTGIPWLPVAPADHSYAAQAADPASLLNFTSRLIAFRSAHAALYAGEMTFIPGPSRDCLCYRRTTPGEHITVAVNLSHRAVRLDAASIVGQSAVLFSSVSSPSADELRPWEVRVAGSV